MRKVYKFLLLGVFMTLAVTSFGQGVGVVMTAAPPTIDGDVSDAAWNAATDMNIGNVSSGTMDAAFDANFKLLWDANFLYIAVSVDDDTLKNTNMPSSFAQDQNDFIDIYIDMDRRYPYTHTNPNQGPANGSWWNLYDVNDFQVQLLRDSAFLSIGGQFPGNVVDSAASGIMFGHMEAAAGYTFEIAIPYDNLIVGGFDAVHNARLGFEIMVGDADADTVRDGRVAWNMAEGVDLAWKDPTLWGLIVLDDGSGVSLPADNPAVDSAATAPTIDGSAEALWTDVPFREIRNTSSGTMDHSFAADYKALWDAKNLYLLVDIKDDTLRNDNRPAGFAQDDNDFVDLYIDMDRLFPHKENKDNGSWWNTYDLNDYQVQLLRDSAFLNIGGQNSAQTVDSAASGIISGQMEKADGSGWMLEIQVPFDSLDADFMAMHNARLGFEIMVGDADGDTVRDGRVAWNMPAGTDVAWGDPTAWGVLVFSDGNEISAPAATPEIMETATVPVIDGTIDALWSSVDFREINSTTDGDMDDTFAAEFKAVWDATNLYLLVEVQDDVLKNDNRPSAFAQDQNDFIDLYLDTDMKFPHKTTQANGSWWNFYDTTDFQIQFLRDSAFLNIGGQNSNNDVDSAASGITFAQSEVTGGWLLEVSIPWANMDPNMVPAHDLPLGLEVMVGDADTDTLRNGRNAWFMTDDLAWSQPLLWATVILSDGGEITSEVLSLENDLISTSIGVIDGTNIIEIPKSTTAADLVGGVTISAAATAAVHDGSGPVANPDTNITDDMILKIVSEKGLWNDVGLTLEMVPTSLFEDFNDAAAVDSSIWFTNKDTLDDGVTPVFDISIDTALNYDMQQKQFFNGINWQVGMLNLQENPFVSLKIKIEDATYDDGTGAAAADSLPVQISVFSPDPEGGDDIRAGNFTVNVPAAAAGAGTFDLYYFDMTKGDAWISDGDTSFALIDTVTWMLFETVTWPGTYDATISIDDVGIGDDALRAPLPKKTGFEEDFEGEIDMDIWDANRGTHASDGRRIFTVSGDNGTLKVEMDQEGFANGEMFVITKEEWELDMSDPANQSASMLVKVEDATYDGGTGPVAIPTLPFQVSLFTTADDIDLDPPGTNTRVAAISYAIPVAATGEGEFAEYFFDFAPLIAAQTEHKKAEAANIWAILVETVAWPGTHIATYWLDDVRLGDKVIPYVPSDDATIHSSLSGEVGADAVTMVDPGLSVTAFLLGLTIDEKATVVMLESSGGNEVGTPDRTDVTTGMVAEVTAEDGTIKEYAISTDPTSVHTINAESIAVYPNPASEVLNISNTEVFDRIEIANITGKIMEIVDVTANTMHLDISNYDAGIYFIRLESKEYGSVVKKFVKK